MDNFTAVANREIALIRKAVSDSTGSGKSGEACAQHIRLLEDFLKVLPYIVPPKKFTSPLLWHHDLHADNIFVDAVDPTKITGIVDWQAVYISPFFLQVKFPSIFDCEDPYPWGAVQPQLPEDYESMSPQE